MAFVAGATRYGIRPFLVADTVGAAIWSTYNALIGRIGGAVFEQQTWKALLLAFGLAALGTIGIEVVRRLIDRRRQKNQTSG